MCRRIVLLCLVCMFTSMAARGQEPTRQKIVLDFEGNKTFSRKQLLPVASRCLANSQPRNGDDAGGVATMRIRFGIVYLALILLGSSTAANVRAQNETYDVPLVKGLLQHPEGLGWSGFDKQVNRLGDRVSIALLKILEEKDFQSPQTVKSVLQLIRHSFLFPQLISIPADKEPRVTLFLLTHMENELKDPASKEQISQLIKFVKTQTSKR